MNGEIKIVLRNFCKTILVEQNPLEKRTDHNRLKMGRYLKSLMSMGKTKDKMNTHEISKESTLISTGTVEHISVVPQQYAYLYGRPGKEYTLLAVDLDQNLRAVVSAYQAFFGDHIMNKLHIDPSKAVTSVFKMGPSGYVTVYNFSANTHHSNPKVSFILVALN